MATAAQTLDLAAVFGANLRAARERRKLTQAALAGLASLHPNALAMIERGERLPLLDTAVRLARACKTTVDKLAQ